MTVVSGEEYLHLRVSYPLVMRATGLGRLEGGELVLVPGSRAQELVARAHELAQTGIAGIVVLGGDAGSLDASELRSTIPIVLVHEPSDLHLMREAIDRYIVRSRRELFALEQRLHRSIVDAAIAGATIEDLLAIAAAETQALVLLDRGGEIIWSPDSSPLPDGAQLVRARMALDRANRGHVVWDGPPRMLAVEVAAGSERKGVVAAIGLDATRYEADDVVLTSLASGAAIVLAREPSLDISVVEDALTPLRLRAAAATAEADDWQAVAAESDDIPLESVHRAFTTELNVRSVPFVAAREGDSLIVIASGSAIAWNAIVSGVESRTRPARIRAGLGRCYIGPDGAGQSVREALRALDRIDAGLLSYEDVELDVVLRSVEGRDEFVRARLGVLMDESAGGQELLETARAYLGSGRNAKEAARRLQVHRNTLLYRLRRIRELIHVDWDDPEDIFALDLALRLSSMSPDQAS
ncbi:MAG TPA: helix-turn-helix domain-containing protein [Chloroflexota bacterium]